MVRDEWGAVLASLARDTRDLGLAEDALQDAVAAALEVWPRDGVPDRPGAWLTTTARRKAIDRVRKDDLGRYALDLKGRSDTLPVSSAFQQRFRGM